MRISTAIARSVEYVPNHFPIDLNVHADDTEAKVDLLGQYADKLRRALHANKNRGNVEHYTDCDKNILIIYGEGNGNNKRIIKLLQELSRRDCYVYRVAARAELEEEFMTPKDWFDLEYALGVGNKNYCP